MTTKRSLSSQTLVIEERTSEITIVMPPGSEAGIRVLRERHIVDQDGTIVAKSEHYALGRYINKGLLEQEVEISTGKITLAAVEEALIKFTDMWADEDLPIYGTPTTYLKPIK